MAVPPHLAKKRAPLGNLTNFKNVSHSAAKSSVPPAIMVLTYSTLQSLIILFFGFFSSPCIFFFFCGCLCLSFSRVLTFWLFS